MIQDKDYQLRQIRQLNKSLDGKIIENPEGKSEIDVSTIESVIKDLLKLRLEHLLLEDMNSIASYIELNDHIPNVETFELLGHLFFLMNKVEKNSNENLIQKASFFYSKFMNVSDTFSITISMRLQELKIN